MKRQYSSNKKPYRKVRKDYHRQDLKNPFFRPDEKGKRRRLRWLVLVFLIVISSLLWFFYAAPCWRFSDLRLEGIERTSEERLRELVYEQAAKPRALFFHQDNIFMFDGRATAENIRAEFNLADVFIERKLPRTLIVKVSERPITFIFREGSAVFYASADGYIIKEPAVNMEGDKVYPILENKSEASLINSLDQLKIKQEYLDFFLELAGILSAEADDLPIENFIIDQEFNMLTFKAAAGPAVYFNINDSAAAQVERLILVKKEKIKDNFNRTNYIDLRYGDTVFVNPDFK